jgi:predicted phage terminase large subunit-like protein
MTTLTLPKPIDVEALKKALDKAACEQSLAEFVKRAWRHIEPGQVYFHSWHIGFICEHLEAIGREEVVDGDVYNRLLINVPPGMMKSMLVSVFFPAWLWGPKNKPHMRFICASHNVDLAMRDNLRMRRLVQSEWYAEHWGDRVEITSDQNEKKRFENRATGWRAAVAAGGMTGHRADIVIIDDPHSVEGADSDAEREGVNTWFQETVPTRLNRPDTSAIIVVMQRIHEHDVSGVILDGNLGYDHICLPMRFDPDRACSTKLGYEDPREARDELLFEDRFPLSVVERDERIMGPYAAAGQFQQSPIPRGGGVIKDSDWILWDKLEYPPLDFIIASIDTAYTEKTSNDYSALTVWGVFSGDHDKRATRMTDRYGKPFEMPKSGGPEGMSKVVLMYAFAERLELHALVKRVAESCKAMKVDRLLIEGKASGISVAQEMRRLYAHEPWAVHLINPGAQDKLARLYSVQHLFAEGMIYAPDKTWAEQVIRQVASFPKGKHDDLCFVAGTRITTRRGNVPVEQVTVNDEALTPVGWRPVIAAGCTGFREVVTIKGLTGTGAHPLFTLDLGYQRLDTISQASKTVGLGLCDLIKTIRRETFISTVLATHSWGADGNTISAKAQPMRGARTPKDCMSLSGKNTTASLLVRAMKSTMSTATLLISALKIWSAYQKTCIADFRRSMSTAKLSESTWQSSGQKLLHGINLKRAVHGTATFTARQLRQLCTQVRHACQKAMPALFAAFMPATGAAVYSAGETNEKSCARPHASLQSQSSCVGSAKPATPTLRRVYNLTVKDAHCYYANGVLVHNCDSVSMAIRHLRESGLLVRSDERLADLANEMDFSNIRQPPPLYNV